MAIQVNELCAKMHQHLEGILAVTRHVTAGNQAAQGNGAPVAGSRTIAGVKGVAMRLEAEMAGLAANCRELVSMVHS